MPNLQSILEIPTADWCELLPGKRFARMPRATFVQRCGMPNDAALIDAFGAWAFKQSRSYALVWDSPVDLEDDIQLVVRESPP